VTDTPHLGCPLCGAPLFPARRGVFSDHEFAEHRPECRCRHCGPMWIDEAAPLACCGVLWRVECDDGHAYVVVAGGGQ